MFRYIKNPNQYTIIVKYQDASGNAIRADASVKVNAGNSYTATAPTIPGYTLTGASTQTLNNISSNQTITFRYTKNQTPTTLTGTATIQFKNGTTGAILKTETVNITENQNVTYTAPLYIAYGGDAYAYWRNSGTGANTFVGMVNTHKSMSLPNSNQINTAEYAIIPTSAERSAGKLSRAYTVNYYPRGHNAVLVNYNLPAEVGLSIPTKVITNVIGQTFPALQIRNEHLVNHFNNTTTPKLSEILSQGKFCIPTMMVTGNETIPMPTTFTNGIATTTITYRKATKYTYKYEDVWKLAIPLLNTHNQQVHKQSFIWNWHPMTQEVVNEELRLISNHIYGPQPETYVGHMYVYQAQANINNKYGYKVPEDGFYYNPLTGKDDFFFKGDTMPGKQDYVYPIGSGAIEIVGR
jgi:hypothetical protein